MVRQLFYIGINVNYYNRFILTFILSTLTIWIFNGVPAWALTPIAHTDVVSRQRIEYGTSFNFGVAAFCKGGIEKVDFVISGQGYSGGTKTSTVMALNTRIAGTTPDGKSWPGVWEYYVTISSSEFTHNGTITVTPTVHDNGSSDTRALSAVTLYVEGESNTTPTEAWVDAGESDGTGTLNDENDPYPTIAAALSDIETANGNCDYAIVYLAEDTYSVSSLTPTTSAEWLTITKEAAADINNVVFTNAGISTNYLHMKDVTFYDSTANNSPIFTNNNSWIDGCRMIGAGYNQNGESQPVVMGSGGYFTNTYSHDMLDGISTHQGQDVAIIRNASVYQVGNDVATNAHFVANLYADYVGTSDITDCSDYGYSGANCHADGYQIYLAGDHAGPVDNILLYGYVAVNLHYQTSFMRQEDQTYASNVALVNCLFELRDYIAGGGFGTISGDWIHLLLWHNTWIVDDSAVNCTTEGNSNFGAWWWYPDGTFSLNDSSIVGNHWHWYRFEGGASSSYLAYGNSYGNDASYNHFEYMTSSPTGCTSSYTYSDSNSPANMHTGDSHVIQDDYTQSDFMYPLVDSDAIDAVPSIYVPCDAMGNARDSSPDIGALEYPPPSVGPLIIHASPNVNQACR